MKESNYKTYDELPLFLNAETVAGVLGIAMSSAYELMKEKEFPALRVGNRLIVPKEKFISWVEMKTEVSKLAVSVPSLTQGFRRSLTVTIFQPAVRG